MIEEKLSNGYPSDDLSTEDAYRHNCPVCTSTMVKLFSAMVLAKYEVDYFRCRECGTIQTDQPYWLDEAYDSAIADLDVGLVKRNLELSKTAGNIIDSYFDVQGRFLDFAGGYGLFVRLMRDQGFNFFHYDAFCQNLFAKYFSISDLDSAVGDFELITAFEFFEHVNDPVTQCERMLSLTETIIFTTELAPDDIRTVEDWWYFVPESGQHITFYTRSSLMQLASQLNGEFYSDGTWLHAITRKKLDGFSLFMENSGKGWHGLRNRFLKALGRKPPRTVRDQSVSTMRDYQYIKRLLNR
ncbi:class I SAM-dependent methyltransferase [Thermodesulfobacteriota bacterium]